MGRWSHLKGVYPEKPDDPSRAAALHEATDAYRGRPIAVLGGLLTDLAETQQAQAAQLKATEFEIEAVERAICHAMDLAGLDSTVTGGYRLTPSAEPYPNVVDRVAQRAWAEIHVNDALAIPHQTLKALTKAALADSTPLPDGIAVYMKTTLSRTKSKG